MRKSFDFLFYQNDIKLLYLLVNYFENLSQLRKSYKSIYEEIIWTDMSMKNAVIIFLSQTKIMLYIYFEIDYIIYYHLYNFVSMFKMCRIS